MKQIILIVFLINGLYISLALATAVKFSPQMIPVCYNFGCKIKDYVSLTSDDWRSVEVIFKPVTKSEKIERIRKIGRAHV